MAETLRDRVETVRRKVNEWKADPANWRIRGVFIDWLLTELDAALDLPDQRDTDRPTPKLGYDPEVWDEQPEDPYDDVENREEIKR